MKFLTNLSNVLESKKDKYGIIYFTNKFHNKITKLSHLEINKYIPNLKHIHFIEDMFLKHMENIYL